MDYIKEANRTKSHLHMAIPEDVEHGIVGIATEAGELLDAMKKHVFYGKPIDDVNLKEELGDLMWYMALICQFKGWTFDEIQKLNIEKLKKRYPDKFTSEHAEKRDLIAERKVLEGEKSEEPIRQFLVHWEIDIWTDTPKHAAEIAREYQLDPDSTAQVFDVFEDDHFKARVDLLNDTETQ